MCWSVTGLGSIKLSRTFNQGFGTTESVSASLLDMVWHTLPPGAPPQDVKVIDRAGAAEESPRKARFARQMALYTALSRSNGS